MNLLYEGGTDAQASAAVQSLGIKYAYSTSLLPDRHVFFMCTNVPASLPAGLTEYRTDIIRMAREAGFEEGDGKCAGQFFSSHTGNPYPLTLEELERLATVAYAAGAAAERKTRIQDCNSFDLTMERLMIEDKQKWREEIQEMPFIQFPAGWRVRVIPPFGDAVVRFCVQLPSGTVKSVYLDSRNSLGWWDDAQGPRAYWEVHPVQGGPGRCLKENIEELLEMIADESEEHNEPR